MIPMEASAPNNTPKMTFLGIFGVVNIFIYFITKLASLESFGLPYLYPLAPLNKSGLKNSFIKFPTKDLKKRENLLSKNRIKLKRMWTNEKTTSYINNPNFSNWLL